MAARIVLSIETVSVAVHPPVHLRKSVWEPTYIVWMAATVLMVLSNLHNFCWIMFSRLISKFLIIFPTGLILQNGTCIAVSQCPCVYHGTSYLQGHVLQQGCSVWWVWTYNHQWAGTVSLSVCCWATVCSFFSVCTGGVWNCTENNCTGEVTLSE